MDGLPDLRRLIVVAVVAAAVLVALVIAMGGVTISGPNAVGPVTVLPTTSAAPTSAPGKHVAGVVSVQVRHLGGHTYRYRYTLHDTGTTPLGGFQINGNKAKLYNIVAGGWNFFGDGLCGQSHPGILIYWSTTGTPLAKGKSKTFGFDVNTSGSTTLQYAISYSTDTPQFGATSGPKGSSLPAKAKVTCP